MEEVFQSITTALAWPNPETMLRADVVAQELNAARQQDRGIAGDAALQRRRAAEAHLLQGTHKRAEVGVAVPGQQSVRVGQVDVTEALAGGTQRDDGIGLFNRHV